LDESILGEQVAAARILRDDEVARDRRAGAGDVDGEPRCKRPADRIARGSDLDTLKRRYPTLAEFSDSFLQSTPLDTLIKMAMTDVKMAKMDQSRDVEDRLSVNKDLLEKSVVQIPGGSDNRCTILHQARFLPGAGVSTPNSWLAARKVLGTIPLTAISCYDMDSLGLGGLVSSKGWMEVHNPGSTKIRLQMFNCTATTAGGPQTDLNLSELKLAFRALRAAVGLVMPWNKSMEALDGFLVETDFCFTETGNLDKRAKLISQFIDYVL
jgi:hypothetical protein